MSKTQAPDPAQALLVQALEDIIEPFAYIERNLPEGYRLDGCAALQQINSREFYTRIAKEALAAHRSQAIPAPEGADERGAFKAAMEPLGFRLRWCEGVPGVTDGWDNSPAAHAWQGWQARAALAAPKAPEGAQAALEGLFREAIDWGKSYGQRLSLSDTQVSDVCQSFAAQAIRAALAAPAPQAPAEPSPLEQLNILRQMLQDAVAELKAAPQAPVALTDYQIVRIYEQPELAGTRHESGTAKAIAIARAIEAAHGIPAPKEPKA